MAPLWAVRCPSPVETSSIFFLNTSVLLDVGQTDCCLLARSEVQTLSPTCHRIRVLVIWNIGHHAAALIRVSKYFAQPSLQVPSTHFFRLRAARLARFLPMACSSLQVTSFIRGLHQHPDWLCSSRPHRPQCLENSSSFRLFVSSDICLCACVLLCLSRLWLCPSPQHCDCRSDHILGLAFPRHNAFEQGPSVFSRQAHVSRRASNLKRTPQPFTLAFDRRGTRSQSGDLEFIARTCSSIAGSVDRRGLLRVECVQSVMSTTASVKKRQNFVMRHHLRETAITTCLGLSRTLFLRLCLSVSFVARGQHCVDPFLE